MRGNVVSASRAVDEDAGLVAATEGRREEAIAGAIRDPFEVDLVTFGPAHPAALRKNHRHGLARRELRFGHGLGGLALDDRRTALVAVHLGERRELALDELLEACFRSQRGLQIRFLAGELRLLAFDLHLLELGEMTELDLENRLGLDIGELEALHEDGLGLVLLADDLDDDIDIEIRDQEA